MFREWERRALGVVAGDRSDFRDRADELLDRRRIYPYGHKIHQPAREMWPETTSPIDEPKRNSEFLPVVKRIVPGALSGSVLRRSPAFVGAHISAPDAWSLRRHTGIV